ncbi:MAG: hypothetical protein KDK33_03275 [Leptospiraceae bacterium]|nr:hypothetical protein [Leptospiraceae bacterium]
MGNPDVPFGIVKIMGYQSSELRLSDFASTIKDLGTALTVEFVLSKLEDKYSKIEAVLIEHGNDL